MNTNAKKHHGIFVVVIAFCLFGTLSGYAADHFLNIKVSSETSLVHLGSIDSFDITVGGIKVAQDLLQALETGSSEYALKALSAYNKLIPDKNFGGEYTALKWFCEYFLATEEQRATMIKDPFVNAFFHFFGDDNYATLKEYLERKYHLKKLGDENTVYAHRREGFLEDFILFNNPAREDWEKSSQIIDALGVKPGQMIADIGSGPGYYAVKFSKLTGPSGRVFAIELNSYHNFFLRTYCKLNQIGNVEVVQGELDNIGLKQNSVDLAFSCSLYHIIYTTYAEREKNNFVMSIRNALKDKGRLVLIDNTPIDDDTLPYHGPCIDKNLIVGQLWYYGFRLVTTHQFIPQRYILVFEKIRDWKPGAVTANEADKATLKGIGAPPGGKSFDIPIVSKESLVHIPNEGVPDTTQAGREAAVMFYKGLQTGNLDTLKAARRRYEELIPREKFGDEYTAFVWFCDYLLASPVEKQRMLQDKLVAGYFDLLGGNDFEVIKTYLKSRYRLEEKEDGALVLKKDQIKEIEALKELSNQQASQPGADFKITSSLALAFLDKDSLTSTRTGDATEEQLFFWRDFILFNNPYRENWEQTSLILKALNLRPGQTVADVGSGPGYYSFKFSQKVGPEGRVFAVDTNRPHLDYIAQLRRDVGAENIQTVLSELNDIKLPENSVDHAFLCSLYNVVYTTSMEKVKDGFIASIRKALKPKGRLIIVDNAVVKKPDIPYHGPYIDKRLVVAQLAYYGFQLVEEHQFIPQRYVLIFEKSRMD